MSRSDPNSAEAMAEPIDEETLQELYTWIDEVPLSRPKRNLTRDFSDGVMVAEVVRHFFPRYVEMHNYTPASAGQQKQENWKTLNRKAFKKLGFEVADDIVRQVVLCKQYVIEHVLLMLKQKITDHNGSESESNSSQGMYNARPQQMEDDYGSQGSRPRHQNGDMAKPPRGKQTSNTINSPGKPPPSRIPHKPLQNSPLKTTGQSPRLQGMTKASSMNNIPGGGKTEMVPMVLYQENIAVLERKEQECLAKEETIQILQAKIRRLEQLVHLKDIRIEELQTKGPQNQNRWK